MPQLRNDQMVEILKTEFQTQYDSAYALLSAHSMYLSLPGIRGVWTLAGLDGAGDFVDSSGNGLTLTNNGVQVTYLGSIAGMGAHGFFVASSGDYAWRADAAAFDITGGESYVAPAIRGVTFGCWCRAVALPGTVMNVVAKWLTTGNQRSYRTVITAGSAPSLELSTDGTAVVSVTWGSAIAVNTWYHIVGRYTYDATTPVLSLFVNGVKLNNSTAIPTSIFNSTANFTVGSGSTGTSNFDGRICQVFLCCSAVPDPMVKALYHKTRAMFGVR